MLHFEYMSWAKSQRPGHYNLARSGVVQLHLSDLPIEHTALDINGNNVYGYQPLLQAIATRYGVEEEQVVLTQGASFANYLVHAALLHPGDEAIVEQPTYEVLHKLPLLFHAAVKRLPRRFDNKFQIDPDDLRRLVTDRTRLIVLTNLHNPAGVRIDDNTLIEIGDIAGRVGARVLVDEVYLETYYRNRPLVAARLGDTFITTSSLTKAYGLDGLRCGWVICERGLAAQLRQLYDFCGVVGVFIAEQIGAAVFAHLETIAEKHRGYIRQNLQQMHAFMDEHPQLQWAEPDNGVIAFPKLTNSATADHLAEVLRRKYDVLIVPGHFFESPAHFRIAWGIPSEKFSAALDRLEQALQETQQK